jgi:translation initiation factor IF-3
MIRGSPFERRPDTQRINQHIRIAKIRVIGPEGEQLGVMTPEEGRKIARDHSLDLVEVASEARPPVCKILNYDRYRYEQAKKKTASKSDRVELKTIRMRPRTDEHDLTTKLKQVEKFLAKGNKVKLEMAMRGRERAYTGRWAAQLSEIAKHLSENAKITSMPRAEGRIISMMVEPVAAQSA